MEFRKMVMITLYVFLYIFALITEEDFLISLCYFLELCIQVDTFFLFCFAFHFSYFHSYLEGLPDSPFASLCFFFLGMVVIPVSCTMSQKSIHSSSSTSLSDLVPSVHFTIPLYNSKEFDLGHT